MARAGIAVTVTELPFAEYENRLKKGQFDLYLGEVRLSAGSASRSFLTPAGRGLRPCGGITGGWSL